MDESTLGWLPVLVACWMKVGCQKRIPTPGQQQWRHLFGAYNWATDEVITQISETRTSDDFIAFLDYLVAQHDGKRPLIIVLDNGSIHKSKAMRTAFSILKGELLPLFLPKYCSQLNPIERFWKHLKQRVTSNRLFATVQDMLHALQTELVA